MDLKILILNDNCTLDQLTPMDFENYLDVIYIGLYI